MSTKDLARQIAAARAAQVARLQPAKQAANLKARALVDARRSQIEHADRLMEERDVTRGNPNDLYPTPDDLAARMVEIAGIDAGSLVLEPSAGTGRICQAIVATGAMLIAVEWSYNACKLLERRGYAVTCCDFLEYTDGPFDAVIMNPPFSHEVDHVLHALELLKSGGRLVSVMSAGIQYRSDFKTAKIRERIEAHGYIEQLPPEMFKASGTLVNTCLVVIDR